MSDIREKENLKVSLEELKSELQEEQENYGEYELQLEYSGYAIDSLKKQIIKLEAALDGLNMNGGGAL